MGIINSVYDVIFYNHQKVGNPEGIWGNQKMKTKPKTINENLVNWPEPKEAKNALEGYKIKKKKKRI